MSQGKQLKKNTSHCENNPRGCDADNGENSASCGCDSIFSCCMKKAAETNEISWDIPCDEYDYIVEKLAIKRVPIALFATAYDVYKSEDTERNTEDLPPTCQPQKMYPIVQAVNSSLFYTSANSAGPPGFSSRPSNKTLRFTRNEDVFHDDALNASTSGYNDDDHLTSPFRNTELLNKFTALHPNLKESERAPKDPCPLNTTRSRRSLAEEISEIAATKESPSLHYHRTRNEIVTTESVYAAQPGTSGELSTVPAVEEIPTRDKAEETSSRYRTGSTSCFPFGWRSDSRNEDAEALAAIPRIEESPVTDVQDSSGSSKNPNFIIAPVQVHYTSPKLETIRKMIREGRNRIDTISGNKQQSNYETWGKDMKKERLEESSIDGNSEATEEPSIDNLAGTTLRWKIIIKHHPPVSPAISSTSKISSQPILSKALRDTIEARNRRDSASLKNNKGSHKKIKEEILKRTS